MKKEPSKTDEVGDEEFSPESAASGKPWYKEGVVWIVAGIIALAVAIFMFAYHDNNPSDATPPAQEPR